MRQTEMKRTVGAATPNGPEAEIQEALNISQADGNLNGCSPTTEIAHLFRSHRRLSSAMAALDEHDDSLTPAIIEIEHEMMTAQPQSIADVYRRLLVLCPTLETDLFAPELAPLRAEVEAAIWGALA